MARFFTVILFMSLFIFPRNPRSCLNEEKLLWGPRKQKVYGNYKNVNSLYQCQLSSRPDFLYFSSFGAIKPIVQKFWDME